MQKRLPNIQVLPKQQSILKIKKVWLLAWNKCTKWLSFQTTCLWVVFVSGLPCGTERDWMECTFPCSAQLLLCRSTHASLFNLRFFFIHYETKTKAKFIYLSNLREWQLNLKSMKMSWIIKLMIVVQSFNIIVWPRPFLKLIQFKMSLGTYDPLLLISRRNSLLNNTHHKPISLYHMIYHYWLYALITLI